MLYKMCVYILLLLLSLTASSAFAQYNDDDNGIGQTIQIYTRFRSFVGKPSWLLIIRDIDHNENVPYLFDMQRGNNFWVAYTRGRNYTISASDMQIETYQPKTNTFKKYRISNFCHLESNGRISRGESMYITINGDLTQNSNTYTCHVSRYNDSNFTIVKPNSSN